MIISKLFTFEASHILPKHRGKCCRLHGHSWQLIVSVEGPVSPSSGFVVDFGELKELVNIHVIEPLDHTHLGQGVAGILKPDTPVDSVDSYHNPYFGEEFYPSSENLCQAIFKLLKPLVKELGNEVELYSVHIGETCTSSAVYTFADDEARDHSL